MGVKILSDNSSDELRIDPTSKAARATRYSSDGTYEGQKQTYRASSIGTTTVVSGTAPFFTFYGSATKTIRVLRVVYQATVATAAVHGIILLSKRSTARSGGTQVALTQTPVDSNNTAGTATDVALYTAAPTAGTLVGTLAVYRTILALTAATAAAERCVIYDAERDEAQPIVLRGTAQGIDLSYQTAPGNTTAVTCFIEWVEY